MSDNYCAICHMAFVNGKPVCKCAEALAPFFPTGTEPPAEPPVIPQPPVLIQGGGTDYTDYFDPQHVKPVLPVVGPGGACKCGYPFFGQTGRCMNPNCDNYHGH